MNPRVLPITLVAIILGGCQAGGADGAPREGGPDASGGGPGSGGFVEDPTALGTALIAPRIRRLTNAELENSVNDLLGSSQTIAAGLVPDTRQQGYTPNADQIVAPQFANQLQLAANQAAQDFVQTRLPQVLPCSTTTPDAACATQLFQELLPRAYRKPLMDADLQRALAVFNVGAESSFTRGIELALSAVLQSASFLYTTELGDSSATSPSGTQTTLTAHEIATLLAYSTTERPPDPTLLGLADSGTLLDAQVRAEQSLRLMATPGARAHVERLITEWLGVDRVVEIGKSAEAFPGVSFDSLRVSMLQETRAFASSVLIDRQATISDLFVADFTVVDDPLADFYGLPRAASPGAPSSLQGSGRQGILNQGSFLARYASDIDSAPVLRGITVLRRLLCIDPGDPTQLNIEIVPPPPDPNATTRQRFAVHVENPACKVCHRLFDPMGNSFENFDATGRLRTTEQNQPVDTTGSFDLVSTSLGTASFNDSVGMTTLLASSPELAQCFGRNLFRFVTAQSDPLTVNAFLELWQALPPEAQDSVQQLMLTFAASDLFVLRGVQ